MYPKVKFKISIKKDIDTLLAFTKDANFDGGENLNWAIFRKYPELKKYYKENKIIDLKFLEKFIKIKYQKEKETIEKNKFEEIVGIKKATKEEKKIKEEVEEGINNETTVIDKKIKSNKIEPLYMQYRVQSIKDVFSSMEILYNELSRCRLFDFIANGFKSNDIVELKLSNKEILERKYSINRKEKEFMEKYGCDVESSNVIISKNEITIGRKRYIRGKV